MHIVDKNYIALFDHGIKMLVTYQLYILDPRFVPRLFGGDMLKKAVGYTYAPGSSRKHYLFSEI